MRIGVFMVALAVRIAAIEATGAGSVRFGDGADYIATARSVCSEQVYPERGNLPFFRPPGLPFLIAGATLCETSQVRVIKYALAACDAATAVVIFELALLVWGGRPARNAPGVPPGAEPAGRMPAGLRAGRPPYVVVDTGGVFSTLVELVAVVSVVGATG